MLGLSFSLQPADGHSLYSSEIIKGPILILKASFINTILEKSAVCTGLGEVQMVAGILLLAVCALLTAALMAQNNTSMVKPS